MRACALARARKLARARARAHGPVLIDSPPPPLLLLRMPMTKAVVRAMDAVTDYAQKSFGVHLEKFVVGGASKRGWTTWTTGVVDKRCAAIVPVVMDLLNLAENTGECSNGRFGL